MDISNLHSRQPWRINIGNPGFHHLGHVLVGIIVKEGRAAGMGILKVSVRQET